MHIKHEVSLNSDYAIPLNKLINEEFRQFIHDLNNSNDSHDIIIEIENLYNKYNNLCGFSLSLTPGDLYTEIKINLICNNHDLDNESLIIDDIEDMIGNFCYNENLEEYKSNVDGFLLNEFKLNNRKDRYYLYDKILFNNSTTSVYPLLSNILQKKYNFKKDISHNCKDDILIINDEVMPFFETNLKPWFEVEKIFHKYNDFFDLTNINRIFNEKEADTIYLKYSCYCPVYKKDGKLFITASDYELPKDGLTRILYPYEINKNFDTESINALNSIFKFIDRNEIKNKTQEFLIEKEKKIIQNSLLNVNKNIIVTKKNRI